jgi:hypothetical protein
MGIKPVRITRSRQHKQVSPNGLPIVYVGRGSKWGNPFVIGKHGNREDVLWKYVKYIQISFGFNLKDLKGKNLSCFCKQDEACHADYLLGVANNENK